MSSLLSPPPTPAPRRPLGPILGTDPLLDIERRAALRRMRTVAVGLLVLAAVVYVLTLDQDGFWGFVNAGAEASMIGAIADWFAVVALFKHPLGIPIPHTALVPRKKEMLARSLEDFVGENFLQEEVVRSRLLAAEPSRRVGDWLAEEANARRLVSEGADLLRIGVDKVRDEEVAEFVRAVLLPRLREEPISPLAGTMVQAIVADGAHHNVVDLLLDEADGWLRANPDVFYDVMAERAPWWAPEALNERVIRRLHVEVLAWIEDVRTDPRHRLRDALDALLEDLAEGLLHDPDTIQRMERVKERLLDRPEVATTVISLWNALRRAFVAALDDPTGPLTERAVGEVRALGGRLRADAALRARVDERAAGLAVFLVGRYGAELTSVITHTIDQWDGREASRKIELQVGKDLQFIRINGTLVGGLVGILIHAITVVAR